MRRFFYLFVVIFLMTAHISFAAMTSTNYQIRWDSVDSGGMDVGTSTNYALRDSIGGMAIGMGTSTNYQNSAGYRAGDVSAEILMLSIGAQNTVSLTVYSSFLNAGKQISVSSTSAYAVGDVIAVLENQGLSQQVAVGKITSISGNDLHVDVWAGDHAGMTVNPSGGNDFVVNLSTTVVSFGSLNPGSATTSVAFSAVQTDISTGYSVYVQGNQVLQNANGNSITSVTDGAVTAGSEEYGTSVTGATAFGAGTDTTVTTTQRVVQTSAAATGTTPDRVAMTYKVAITASTSPGSYSQDIYFTVTANY